MFARRLRVVFRQCMFARRQGIVFRQSMFAEGRGLYSDKVCLLKAGGCIQTKYVC